MHGPTKCTHKIFIKISYSTSLKIKIAVDEASMEAALHVCNQFLSPNYFKIAADHGLERIILIRRYLGQIVSRQEATYLYYSLLTRTQEEASISQINKLTVRGLPPTSAIIRNLAGEIIRVKVYKNWVSRFVTKRKKHLKSIYLRNIENSRVKAEYRPMIAEFFKLVGNFFY
jgi:hypothetical protein